MATAITLIILCSKAWSLRKPFHYLVLQFLSLVKIFSKLFSWKFQSNASSNVSSVTCLSINCSGNCLALTTYQLLPGVIPKVWNIMRWFLPRPWCRTTPLYALSIYHSIFMPKYSENTPHSSPVRARYGCVFWVHNLSKVLACYLSYGVKYRVIIDRDISIVQNTYNIRHIARPQGEIFLLVQIVIRCQCSI